MNRFEQKSMSLGRKLIYLLPILAFVILFVLFLRGIGSVGESTPVSYTHLRAHET